jgi:hypothetical protein
MSRPIKCKCGFIKVCFFKWVNLYRYNLARYMDMCGEDIQALSRHKMTLGTLEKLTAGDLSTLGVNNPMDAIAILRAAPALVTLRNFRASHVKLREIT